MSGCSNLDPVRRGSLIPDYGSLGLRHADAQVCTHLQSPNLSIWLSALNLKPHPEKSIKVKLWQQCRCLKWDVLLKVLACWSEWFTALPLSDLRCFCPVWSYSTSVQRDLQRADALNCRHTDGSGLAEMKVSICRHYLTEHKWWGHQGGEENKAKQTLHLYGIANHHADTHYMSYRIKVGTTGNSSG